MTSFYGFFILFLQFLQFFLFFSAFLHTILSHHYISLPSLFFFTLCMSLFLYCTLSHLACNSWFFLSISWSARFLCVSIITSLYACHHFSEPKLYIGPYFLQVFLLLLCFSVFVFCFVIKYSQFCIFPLGVLENTLHFSLCFFLLFPLFLFSAFQCYFVVLHQTLLATLLLFFPHVLELTLQYSVYFLLLFLLFVHFCILCSAFFQAPSLTRSLFTVWVCRFTFPVELGWHTCFQSGVTCA